MSDRNYSPYGLDDDPFLTHPAGAGQSHGRGYARENHAQVAFRQQTAQPNDDGDHGYADQTGRGFAPSDARYAAPIFGAKHSPHAGYNSAVQRRPQDDGYNAGDDAGYDQQYDSQYAHVGGARHGQFGSAPRSMHQFTQTEPDHTAHARSYDPRFAPARNHAQDLRGQPDAQPEPTRAPRSCAPLPGAPAYRTANDKNAVGAKGAAAAYGAADAYGAAPSFRDHGARAVQWAGALCTIVVVLGAVYWGYALAVRDATGIPVVRAAMGPLRIAPETPGGDISAHQGLAVNAIPAAALDAPLPQDITLAPQTGTISAADTLTESGSFAQLGGQGEAETVMGASDMAAPTAAIQAGETAGIDLTALPDALPEDLPLSDEDAVVRALEMALAEGADALPPPAPLAADVPTAPETASSEPVGMAAANPADLAPSAPPTAEVDPATIAVGTAMVQLGAFDDAALARAEWASLQTRFTELFAAKALVVQQAQSGGRDFYRLRAHGFDSPDETRRFCAAILAENGTCLPVVQR